MVSGLTVSLIADHLTGSAYSVARARRDAAALSGRWVCERCGSGGADLCCNSCPRTWHHQCYGVSNTTSWSSLSSGTLHATVHFASLSRSLHRFTCAVCLLASLVVGQVPHSLPQATYLCELIMGSQCAHMHAVTLKTQGNYVSAVKRADNFFDETGIPVLPCHGTVATLQLEMFLQHHSHVGGSKSGGKGLAVSTLEGVRAGIAYAFAQFGVRPPFSDRTWKGLRRRIGTDTAQVWSMTIGVVHALLAVLEGEGVKAKASGDVDSLLEVVESQLLVAIMWYGGLRGNEPMSLLIEDFKGPSGTGVQRARSGGCLWNYVLLVFRFPTKGNQEGRVIEVPLMAITGEGINIGRYCQRCILVWAMKGRVGGPAFLSASGRASLKWGGVLGWCRSRLQPRVNVVKASGHEDLQNVQVCEVHDNTFRRGFDTHAQDAGVHVLLIEQHQRWRGKGSQHDRLVIHYDRGSLWRALLVTLMT